MSDKKRRGIVQAIASLLEGGMEQDRVAHYIRDTYCLSSDDVLELMHTAHHRRLGSKSLALLAPESVLINEFTLDE